MNAVSTPEEGAAKNSQLKWQFWTPHKMSLMFENLY